MSSPPVNTTPPDTKPSTADSESPQEAPPQETTVSNKEADEKEETIVIGSETVTKLPRIKICLCPPTYYKDHKAHPIATGTQIVHKIIENLTTATDFECMLISYYNENGYKTGSEDLRFRKHYTEVLRRNGHHNHAIAFDELCFGYHRTHKMDDEEYNAYLTSESNLVFCESCVRLIEDSGGWTREVLQLIKEKRRSLEQTEKTVMMLQSFASDMLSTLHGSESSN